ncbi:MAG: hypothetical protein FJY85_24450 [Deltaproteobacteria bacterium]|nr:hypothetical protein [Deltaproteobacteria bacterium]
MLVRVRMLVLLILILFSMPFIIDFAVAHSRLGKVIIEASLDPPSVVADGKSSAVLTIRVTERGKPRVHDLLQLWFEVGRGTLVPDWVYTDERGIATVVYSPNPLTQYDVQDKSRIHIYDLGIGRLIEVGKNMIVDVPLIAPEEQARKKIFE